MLGVANRAKLQRRGFRDVGVNAEYRLGKRGNGAARLLAVAPVTARPYAGTGGWDARLEAEGAAPNDSTRRPYLNMEITNADYLRVNRVPLLSGRWLLPSDRENAPRVIVLSFRHNPTTACVDREFFQQVVDFARERGVVIVHDNAYAELGFDGFRPPSILQADGAKECAVELYSMTKAFSMAGWRLAFLVGNADVVQALAKLKSYLDYGTFQPIQIASIVALRGPQDCVEEITAHRDDLIAAHPDRFDWPEFDERTGAACRHLRAGHAASHGREGV